MIISHKYRFIFIKTRKTAGTSIEVTLSKYCGEEDVITPIDPPEEGHEPRNFWIDEARGVKFYNHMPAREIRALVGPDIWNSYFTFCFERHPYLKTVSLFRMHRSNFRGNKTAYTFDRWMRPDNAPSDFFMYTDEADKTMVDQIFRYRTLDESFKQVCEKLGIPCGELESHAKAGFEKVPVEILPQHKAFLQQQFAAEFEMFGFSK